MKLFGKKDLGNLGESLAKKFLKKKGLKFIENNFKYYRKEIDLIFCDKRNKVLIFVEVKTRTGREYGEPENAINFYKQNNIRQGAVGFLQMNREYEEYDIRFDSVSVVIGKDKPDINHTENAF